MKLSIIIISISVIIHRARLLLQSESGRCASVRHAAVPSEGGELTALTTDRHLNQPACSFLAVEDVQPNSFQRNKKMQALTQILWSSQQQK